MFSCTRPFFNCKNMVK